MPQQDQSIIGQYGAWAASRLEQQLPVFSFRRTEWTDLEQWRVAARRKVEERLAVPDIDAPPIVNVKRSYHFQGLVVEEMTWQLPYGGVTEAVLLKPQRYRAPLPGVLAFHDHGGDKYFGLRKIVRTEGKQHPMMVEHQRQLYEGRAWANELAMRGYAVLVVDGFAFGSRRVLMRDVPPELRDGLSDEDPENENNIQAYNRWAKQHEHILAKSLFCAGTTWPGVFFAEDRIALDILCKRDDVDPARIGCCGLSGGGLRTVLLGGLDARIKCAIPVGFMSTWKDFLLNKAQTHTWMLYIPLLPNELDFPEILSLRAPLPTLVLNDAEDKLFTPAEMKRADEIVSEVYTKANAGDHYRCTFHPGPHKFDVAMQSEAFAWLDRWLKP